MFMPRTMGVDRDNLRVANRPAHDESVMHAGGTDAVA
jgi:hypothetical protein